MGDKKQFTHDQLVERTFLRVAQVIYELWEEGTGDTRLLNDLLIPDKFVVAGQSREGQDHREHVVPRIMIYDECLAMFDRNASVRDVADFIRKYLKIIYISRDEQRRLDYELKLKKTMPEGWKFEEGANVFARLDKAGISYQLAIQTE